MDEELSQHSREIAKGSFWGVMGTALFNIISFFYVILVARTVAQDELGLFYLALGIISVFSIFDDLGLGMALIRYVPFFQARGEDAKVKGLLKKSYIFVTLSGLAITALMWVASDLIGSLYSNPGLSEAIRLLSIYLAFSNILKLGTMFLQSIGRILDMQLFNNLSNILRLAFSLLFISLMGPSVTALVLGTVMSFVVPAAICFIYVARVSRSLPEAKEPVDEEFFRRILPFGLLLNVIQSLSAVMISMDRSLLGYMIAPSLSESVVAVYTVAGTFSGVVFVFPSAMGSIFLPVMSRLFGKNDLESMRAAVHTAQRWCLFLAIPVSIVLIAFSSELLSALYGENYASGAPVLALFSLGYVIKSFCLLLGLTIASMRFVRLEFKILVISGLANLVLNVALISLYGSFGSAVAFLLTAFVLLFLYYYYCRNLFAYTLPYGTFRLIFAGVVSLAFLMLAKGAISQYLADAISLLPLQGFERALVLIQFGVLVSLSLAIFLSSSFLLRCFRKEDVALMSKVLRKLRLPPALIALAAKAVSLSVEGQK
ncbi:MAG TPA: flippase [Candidatus Bilamarchaeum sp.]|nr:flippase [Candidatus Bilamarchaeum sp.]